MEPNTKTAAPASTHAPVVTDDGEQRLTSDGEPIEFEQAPAAPSSEPASVAFSNRASQREMLERAAAKVLGDKEPLGELSDRQVREMAILKVCAGVKFVDADGKARSDAYIEGMFDVLLASDRESSTAERSAEQKS
jgi:hypothetical protein